MKKNRKKNKIYGIFLFIFLLIAVVFVFIYFNLNIFKIPKEKRPLVKPKTISANKLKIQYFKEHPVRATDIFFNGILKSLSISRNNIIVQDINIDINIPAGDPENVKEIRLDYKKYNVLISKNLDFNFIKNIIKSGFEKYIIPSGTNIRYFIYTVKNNCFCVYFYRKKTLFLKAVLLVRGKNNSGFNSIQGYVDAPKIALDIDDVGYDPSYIEKLVSLKIPVTFAIFPDAPFSKKLDIFLHKAGYETIIHMPMESIYPDLNPGDGSLYVTMNKKAIIKKLKKDLSKLPYITGANNHEGSLFTSDQKKICEVVGFLKKKQLFFMDSLTDTKSFAYRCSLELGEPSIQRDVFLDDKPSLKYIRDQLKVAEKLSAKFKRVVVIAHPRPDTIEVLIKKLPAIKKEGYRFVPLCEFLR